MGFEHIRYESDGGLVTLTIDRAAQLNALNGGVIRELRDAMARFHETEEEHILILTGSGEKAFVAGADISEMAAMSEREALVFSEAGQAVVRLLAEGEKITIAAVNGFALGGGCELAAACDFVIAASNAKLGQPEVKLGVIPGFGGTQRLARRVGAARARYLVLTATTVTADEAWTLGLVDRVVEEGTALNEAQELAQRMISGSSMAACRAAKQAIRVGQSLSLPEALHTEARAFARCFTTDDQREGMAAFTEKRRPSFKQ